MPEFSQHNTREQSQFESLSCMKPLYSTWMYEDVEDEEQCMEDEEDMNGKEDMNQEESMIENQEDKEIGNEVEEARTIGKYAIITYGQTWYVGQIIKVLNSTEDSTFMAEANSNGGNRRED